MKRAPLRIRDAIVGHACWSGWDCIRWSLPWLVAGFIITSAVIWL